VKQRARDDKMMMAKSYESYEFPIPMTNDGRGVYLEESEQI